MRRRLGARVPASLTLQDISREGRILLSRDQTRSSVQFVEQDGVPPRDLACMDWAYGEGISDDGKVVMFDESCDGARGKSIVFVRNSDGSPPVKLGFGSGRAISPDGKWVAVTDELDESPRITLFPTRAGPQRQLDTAALVGRANRITWSADGKRLLLDAHEKPKSRRCFVQDVEQGPPQPVTPEGVTAGCLPMPDNRSFFAVVGGQAAIYSIDVGAPRPLPVPASIAGTIRVSADGRWLYLGRAKEGEVLVDRIELATGRREQVRRIAPLDRTGIYSIGNIRLTADGKSYIYRIARQLSDLFLLDGVK